MLGHKHPRCDRGQLMFIGKGVDFRVNPNP
jgi:hypothetical protein